MQSKKYALGACALLIATAAASNKTYTVRKGDTVGTIAKKFHISQKDLVGKNSLAQKKLRIGMTLVIPASQAQTSQAHLSEYTVKSGDNDWVLAHRLGVSIADLRRLNPDTDWRDLQVGEAIKVPDRQNPETPKFKSRFAMVSADSAIIRRQPSQDADKVTLVNSGTKVTVLDFEHGWYQLRFPKGTVGWMRGDLLTPAASPKSEVVAKAPGPKVEYAEAAPKSSHKVAAHVSAPVKVASNMPLPQKQPLYARALDGKGVPAMKGLVESAPAPVVAASQHKTVVAAKAVARRHRRSAVAMVEPSAPATSDELLSRAYSLRGTRYVWGGLSSRGLDCSGFTSTVFRAVGIRLPRTSRSQSTIGTAVSRGELRAGDLLFFRTHRSRVINHVGLYIGDNKFIHASSGAGRVRVDNLAGYYSKQLAGARRVPSVKEAGKSDDRENQLASSGIAPKVSESKGAPLAATKSEIDP